MKNLFILAVAVFTTNSAMALDTTMDLKGRFDYVNTKTDNNPGKSSSGILTTSYLRLTTDAKLNETTSVKLTLDFEPTPTTTDHGLTELVDEAFLTKTWGDFSALFGKQTVMIGGRENDYSSRDIYLTSAFNDEVSDNLTGVTAGYTFAGQNFYLQYMQQTTDSQTPLTDKKVSGVAYYGDFLNKMVMPILSYHKQGTSRSGAYDNFGAVGVRVFISNVVFEADYLLLEKEKFSASGDAELKSIVTHVRYIYDRLQPFAKFIKEDGKKGYTGIMSDAIESEKTAWEVGLEFIPNKDEDLRWHLVYNSSESKQKSPVPTLKKDEQKIYAGLAFNYNVLR